MKITKEHLHQFDNTCVATQNRNALCFVCLHVFSFELWDLTMGSTFWRDHSQKLHYDHVRQGQADDLNCKGLAHPPL